MTPLTLVRRRARSLVTFSLAAILFAAGFAFGTQTATGRARAADDLPPEAQTLLKPVWEAYSMIASHYVDPLGKPLDPPALIDGAIKGMAAALGDRYSYYVAPQNVATFNNDIQGETVGIGAVVNTNAETGEIRVVEVQPGSPSEQAGLRAGDVFLTFDGIDVSTLTQKDLVERAKGEEGSEIAVRVRRGLDVVEMTITRARIVKPNTEIAVLDEAFGYLKLKQFSPRARAEVDDALVKINTIHPISGLILDLRGNRGGQLGALVQVASGFISDGIVLTEQFSANKERVFNTDGSVVDVTMPMVVLVNHNSMSAAEALTGALQDHGRATIIGEQTFGKGTAQTVQPLSNGGALRLTIARWLTPDDHWIHANGITPDIVVPAAETGDVQLQAAVDFLRAQVGTTN